MHFAKKPKPLLHQKLTLQQTYPINGSTSAMLFHEITITLQGIKAYEMIVFTFSRQFFRYQALQRLPAFSRTAPYKRSERFRLGTTHAP